MNGLQGLCDWRCSRRTFIQSSAGALALLTLPVRPAPAQAQEIQYGFLKPHPAAFYRRLEKGLVQCQLCPRNCEVLPGDRGECGVRENREGKYYSLVYGNPCAAHLDPIEKNLQGREAMVIFPGILLTFMSLRNEGVKLK